MQILNRIYDIFKSASLLVVVLMLAFTVPMSAHTNMENHGQSNHQEMSADLDDHAHNISEMDISPFDGANNTHEHENAGCCDMGICISAALIGNFNASKIQQSDIHIALPNYKMTSADQTRLMRPPSL